MNGTIQLNPKITNMKDSLAMSISINYKLVNDDKPVAVHHSAKSETIVLMDKSKLGMFRTFAPNF